MTDLVCFCELDHQHNRLGRLKQIRHAGQNEVLNALDIHLDKVKAPLQLCVDIVNPDTWHRDGCLGTFLEYFAIGGFFLGRAGKIHRAWFVHRGDCQPFATFALQAVNIVKGFLDPNIGGQTWGQPRIWLDSQHITLFADYGLGDGAVQATMCANIQNAATLSEVAVEERNLAEFVPTCVQKFCDIIMFRIDQKLTVRRLVLYHTLYPTIVRLPLPGRTPQLDIAALQHMPQLRHPTLLTGAYTAKP